MGRATDRELFDAAILKLRDAEQRADALVLVAWLWTHATGLWAFEADGDQMISCVLLTALGSFAVTFLVSSYDK